MAVKQAQVVEGVVSVVAVVVVDFEHIARRRQMLTLRHKERLELRTALFTLSSHRREVTVVKVHGSAMHCYGSH